MEGINWFFKVLAVILAAFGFLGFLVLLSWAKDEKDKADYSCSAPCVVKFPQPMHEDGFWIDYRGDGTVRVFCTLPDNRREVPCDSAS